MDYWQISATVLTLISVASTTWMVLGHLLNFNKPYLQRYIVRILLMVPIYSIDAWIAMMVPDASLYLDSFREIYESFVIYSFMKYLLNYLHYDTNLQQYINHKSGPNHLFPFCFLQSCTGGKIFMIRCKNGILQYVVVRPLTTLVAFASQMLGIYGEGNYNPFSGYTYPVLFLINNASQLIAMYSLVIFYTGYQQELHPMKPLAKFFSIKLVIFFSFFQSVLISALLEIELVELTLGGLFPELKTKLDIGKKLQEFLICVDMLVAAVSHQWAFNHQPFIEDDDRSLLEGNSAIANIDTGVSMNSVNQGKSCCEAIFNLFDFSDEKVDVSEHFGHIFTRVRDIFTRPVPLPTIVSNHNHNLSDVWMNGDNSVPTDHTSQRQESISVGPDSTNGAIRLPINLALPTKSYESMK